MALIHTFIQRLTLSSTLRTIRCGPAHSTERPKQPRRRMDHPPTDTVLEAAGLVYDQFRKTSEADATVYVYLFRFRTIDVYRQCLHPLACTGTNTSERRVLSCNSYIRVLLRSALSQSLSGCTICTHSGHFSVFHFIN
jgi:hypothetical protein